MNIFPLSTLPQRTMEILNNVFFWPLKTARASRKDYKLARSKPGFVPRTILFYPEKPKTYHALYKICAYLGWDVTNNPKKPADVRIFFEDKTHRKNRLLMEKLRTEHQIINIDCNNISKAYVDDVFFEVFGYRMSVDPTTYRGACVRKSNKNAVHDGVVLDCPVESPEGGYVYQKFIDTTQGDGQAEEYRLHIFNDTIPISLKRYKNKGDLFNVTVAAEFVDTEDILSKEEQNNVLTFCKRLGMDYGELDALRDKCDGRLYIVDANNTPAGPIGPFYEKGIDLERWFVEMGKETEKAFLAHQ